MENRKIYMKRKKWKGVNMAGGRRESRRRWRWRREMKLRQMDETEREVEEQGYHKRREE